MTALPVALPEMLSACEFQLGQERQIILVGSREADDTKALIGALHARFVPHKIVLLVDSEESRAALSAGIPAIAAMEPLDGRASAYVCRDYACQMPVNTAERLAELIQY